MDLLKVIGDDHQDDTRKKKKKKKRLKANYPVFSTGLNRLERKILSPSHLLFRFLVPVM